MILPKVDIKRILYATDLSKNAHYAFAYAASLANLYGASITLLHALAETPESLDKGVIGHIGAERWEEIKKQHYQEAKETLTAILERMNERQEQVLDAITKHSEKGLSPDDILNLIYRGTKKFTRIIGRDWVVLTLKMLEKKEVIKRAIVKNKILFFLA